MSWDRVIEEHSRLAARLYPPEKIDLLAEKSGLTIAPDGSNDAESEEDLNRYLMAVRVVLGETAAVSAKLKLMHKKRQMGL